MHPNNNQFFQEVFIKQDHNRMLEAAANARQERQLRADRGQNQSKVQPRTGIEDRVKKAILIGIAVLLFAAGLAVAL